MSWNFLQIIVGFVQKEPTKKIPGISSVSVMGFFVTRTFHFSFMVWQITVFYCWLQGVYPDIHLLLFPRGFFLLFLRMWKYSSVC